MSSHDILKMNCENSRENIRPRVSTDLDAHAPASYPYSRQTSTGTLFRDFDPDDASFRDFKPVILVDDAKMAENLHIAPLDTRPDPRRTPKLGPGASVLLKWLVF